MSHRRPLCTDLFRVSVSGVPFYVAPVVKRQAEGKKTVPRISQNISKQLFVHRASFVRYMQYYSREKAVGKIKTRAKNPWHTELPVQDRVLHDMF
jgi:hypothetical protein